ncbi:hypothetical protein [Pseudomonas oryzihabitans]|uniref:Uncharacterized protein n=1 Tax=Pseudomonas oryzihabitans TaxID=47885 RepID=A0ABX3IXI1_9PSED|nr:hypothetical protein [Pseudomonas psychrotolerans]ONN71703.1 hypothetical protein BVL52_08655 [Pseudomonas psychrotolerans]
MYADPKHIRDHITKVRLAEDSDDLLTCLARFHRTQKAVLARDLLEKALAELMNEHNGDSNVA